VLHLALFRTARACHGQLDLTRRVFEHRQVLINRRDDRRPACLAELQRRVRVLGHKYLLDSKIFWLELRDNFTDARVDQLQAGRQIGHAGADTAAAQIG